MSVFAAFIRDLFQNLISAFVTREASKTLAITAAFTALLGFLAGLALTLFTAIQTALQAIVYQVQTPELATFIGVFWPPHYSLCLAVCLSARITRWVYDRSILAAELYWSALAR